MRIVIAPDKFKGSLDARSAAEAMAEGVRVARPDAEVDLAPMADGGEGTLEAILEAERGNRRIVNAQGPLGEAIEVPIGLVRHASVAVVELAQVAGYSLVPAERRDPMRTSTRGLGEVLRVVIETGIEEIIVGLGGSATVDGGAGMMQGLGMTFFDRDGRVMEEAIGGGDLSRIAKFVWTHPPDGFGNVLFTLACDVLNPACGVNGATRVFGPQKGADAAAVEQLEAGMAHWAGLLETFCRRPLRDEPGTGAAGGVALPLLAFGTATIMPGVDLVAGALNLPDRIGRADLVLTGEGRLDGQSMMGKVVGAVGRMCRSSGTRCIALVGSTGEGAEQCAAVLDRWVRLGGGIGETRRSLAAEAEKLIRTEAAGA